MMGHIVSMSIVQGGPGLPILSPSVYECITTGRYPDQVLDADVPHPEVQSLIADEGTHHL